MMGPSFSRYFHNYAVRKTLKNVAKSAQLYNYVIITPQSEGLPLTSTIPVGFAADKNIPYANPASRE